MTRWLLVLSLTAWQIQAQPTSSSLPVESLEIRSVIVNGESVIWRQNGDAIVGASPENISIFFGGRTNAIRPPVRIRYKLDGYDNNWRDASGNMYLTVRFYNAAGDQIALKNFPVEDDSPGWNGSFASSPLTHRRETVVVPPNASRLWIVVSSAGPPSTVGVYAVANLIVSKIANDSPPLVLMRSPSDLELEQAGNSPPPGWERDGTHSSMAKIVTLGQNPTQKALAILDEDAGSHAEWHNSMAAAPIVHPGDNILIEWNEAFTTGTGDVSAANYQKLAEGSYHFRVAEVDFFGNPTGATISLGIIVPPPFWRTSWFWSMSGLSVIGVILGGWRYLAWHRTRLELSRLRDERALERERLRISRDIHDDLGARVTEISLASALAKTKASFPASAAADFEHISKLSRELVAALYETVWAVNPENDNLDALGNYLCQMTNHLCEHAQLPCRWTISDLPRDRQVSSQLRHNIIMAVKEAVHNVIKHSKATEMSLQVEFNRDVLTISVQDNGCGFDVNGNSKGSGLTNMHRRMTDINGMCGVESRAGAGTRVQLQLALPQTH
jgi:signal transduction histidine kinase